jgi:hypothetical protein
MQALDVGPQGAWIDHALVDPDLVVFRDRDQDIGAFLAHGGFGVRAIDIDARLLDEGGGDNKEDEHDEHHVQHGRDIDFALFFFGAGWIQTSNA